METESTSSIVRIKKHQASPIPSGLGIFVAGGGRSRRAKNPRANATGLAWGSKLGSGWRRQRGRPDRLLMVNCTEPGLAIEVILHFCAFSSLVAS